MSHRSPAGTSSLSAAPVNGQSICQDDDDRACTLPSKSLLSSHDNDSSHGLAKNKNYDARTAGFTIKRAATAGEPSPQLSERDSIFADNYLPSENDLPESLGDGVTEPFSTGGNTNPSSSMTAVTYRDLSSSSALASSKSKLFRRSDRFKRSDNRVDKFSGTTRTSPSSTSGYSLRRISSEGHQWAKKVQLPVGTNVMDGNGEQVQMESQIQDGKPLPTRLVGSEDAPIDRTEQDSSSIEHMQQPKTQKERSASRNRSHVDKSIEATVKNPEVGGTARSRKASHMMGIFDNQLDSTAAPSSSRGRHPSWAEPSTSKAVSPTILERPDQTARQLSEARPQSSPQQSGTQGYFDQPTSTIVGEVTTSQPVSPSWTDHDPYFRHQDLVERPKIAQAKTAQGKPFHDVISEISKTHATESNDLETKASGQVSEVGIPSKEQGSIEGKTLQVPNDQEEHISAAIYYPHPGPTAEEIERFASPGELHEPGKSPEMLAIDDLSSRLVAAKLPTDKAAPEHIDISVVSEHEKQVLHGNYQPTNESVQEPRLRPSLIDDKASIHFTSTSESEFESGEELTQTSQAEDMSTTPTQKTSGGKKQRTASGGKPRAKVMLEPYKHQVGGHSTIFRFSRRAVCKQLNNRENEFYERIEQRHPDMLKFLPRYIGVLNVTFSKGPKQPQNPLIDEIKIDTTSKRNSIFIDQTLQGETPVNHDSAPATPMGFSAPRVVSHSQQPLNSIPQVILNQNKHIIPYDYFALPERPRSVDPSHGRKRSSDFDVAESDQDLTSRGKEISPTRPSMGEHSPSWGTTTVNEGLRDKVLREVFGPPPIQYYKRHLPSHSTLPRLKTPGAYRKSNLSMQDFTKASSDVSGDSVHSLSTKDSMEMSQKEENSVEDQARPQQITNLNEPTSNLYSSSASAYDDIKYELEKAKTLSNPSHIPRKEAGQPVRRRHSGTGLIRRRKSVSGQERPNLEYFEEESFAPETDEVFSMENDDQSSVISPSTGPENMKNEGDQHAPQSILEIASNNISKDENPSDTSIVPHIPTNPKEAQQQQQNPNDRVAYFILLEDLTTGMGRPCVLDLKMGTRQYGVEATKKKMESQRRKCKTTTSQQLGVRICGMQTFNAKTKKVSYEDKYFGRDLTAGREFRDALTRFLYDGLSYSSVARHIPTILHKISKLESMVRRLPGYRFYASSLLMLYDAEPERSREAQEAARNGVDIVQQKKKEHKQWPPPIELKIVDFANCVTGEDKLPPNAQAPPAHPHDVDRGYLRGLRTLKLYFERILSDIKRQEFVERGENDDMTNDMKDSGKEMTTEIVTEPGYEEEGEVSL